MGQLVDIGIKRGRATRVRLKVGICGEPNSVESCHIVEMSYVSCSPVAPANWRGTTADDSSGSTWAARMRFIG